MDPKTKSKLNEVGDALWAWGAENWRVIWLVAVFALGFACGKVLPWGFLLVPAAVLVGFAILALWARNQE